MSESSTVGTRTSDRVDRAGLRPEVLTIGPHSDLYLRSDFILMRFGNTVKTKEIQFCHFPGKSDLFGKKFLFHQLPDVMIHAYAKFALLDFVNKEIMGKHRIFYPNQTSPFC